MNICGFKGYVSGGYKKCPHLVSCLPRVSCRRHRLEHLGLGVDLRDDGVGQVLRDDLPLQEVRHELVARLPAAVRKALGPGWLLICRDISQQATIAKNLFKLPPGHK